MKILSFVFLLLAVAAFIKTTKMANQERKKYANKPTDAYHSIKMVAEGGGCIVVILLFAAAACYFISLY